jgi:hypothetical protein
MLQNSRSITTRINPPLSPAEREQRYQQVLRELRDPKFYQIRITGMLLTRGYLWPNERDVVLLWMVPAQTLSRGGTVSPSFGSGSYRCNEVMQRRFCPSLLLLARGVLKPRQPRLRLPT